MKKYDWVLAGSSKTGTTSLHRMLSQHPQVCVSRIKEPLDIEEIVRYPVHEIYFDSYFKNINDQTKVLFDGSPNIFSIYERKQCVNQINTDRINKIKLIYLVRNPVRRLISRFRAVERHLAWRPGNKVSAKSFHSLFTPDYKLKENVAKNRISKTLLPSYFLTPAKKFVDEIFIQPLSDFKPNDLLKFLEIEPFDLTFPHLNKTKIEKVNEIVDQSIQKFLDNNIDFIRSVYIEELEKLEHEYMVDLSVVKKELMDDNFRV